MTDIDDFREKVDDSISKLKKERENAPKDKKEDFNMRIKYLMTLPREYEIENPLEEPKVFISFSGEDGKKLMMRALNSLKHTESFPGGPNFDVVTGMKGDGPARVLDFIKGRMEPCCVFLGILTDKYKLDKADNEGNNCAPGPWILIEAGMAISLGLRCVLLVESTIHKRFWFDVIGGWKQVKFEESNFDLRLKTAIKLIKEHVSELRKD